MLSVGLTGGIGSGKSSVVRMFAELGARVIDSDEITHELLEPGQAVHDTVVSEFGPGIVAPDGSIDRKALGAIVFNDPELRRALNALVHPTVVRRQDEFLRNARAEDPNAVAIVDAALMIETGSYRKYDRLVLVLCSRSQQHARLQARGLSDAEIEARISAQMPLEDKVTYADFVIDNSGTLDATRRQVEEVWARLRELARTGQP